jgi:hypothetical protein
LVQSLGNRITPHISGGSDMRQHRGINPFCDNLRAYLDPRWTPKTGAISTDRRNISAMIRAMGSGEARCGVDERIMEGV